MEKLFIIMFSSFLATAQNNSKELIIDKSGIVSEKIIKGKTYDELFNANNEIFKVGKKFTYSYTILSNKGDNFLVKRGEDVLQPEGYHLVDWKLVTPENQDLETINFITLKVISGFPFKNQMPDYNQTGIIYDFPMKNGISLNIEKTGIIENKLNLWMHPPRSNFFKILELNPFPYIKAPYQIGTKWSWKLEIDEHYQDKRWLEWEGNIENSMDYEIIDQKDILTKLGNLNCFLVQSKAKNRLGETTLLAYFNTLYGFVKLEYQNIDGSKTTLELEKVD